MSRTAWRLSVLLLAPVLAGCTADGGVEIVPVEGTVTMGGKPLEKISLRFIPIGHGPESIGITDEQGHFVLQTTEAQPQDGAVVGLHKVVLVDSSIYTKPFRGRASETEDLTEGKNPRISTKYSVIHATPMQTNITGETENLEIKVDPFEGRRVPTLPGAGGTRAR